jgi:hypothetical protein
VIPVSGGSSANRLVEEEVAFWRGFIHRWAREKDEPAPPRAWEALFYAERKQERQAAEPYDT